ncbi:MAG: GtrA family protein [Pseudomonadota bacterium]
MSKWLAETAYLGRYAGSGVLNTLAGFSVIFLLMALGVTPMLANIGGYLFGLILGFFLSKKLVFRSEGHITSESLRYLAAFLVCFILNLMVLQFALSVLHWKAIFAQLLAAATYTTIMYLLSRSLVFRAGINSSRFKS